jgi:hypothetical protein
MIARINLINFNIYIASTSQPIQQYGRGGNGFYAPNAATTIFKQAGLGDKPLQVVQSQSNGGTNAGP